MPVADATKEQLETKKMAFEGKDFLGSRGRDLANIH